METIARYTEYFGYIEYIGGHCVQVKGEVWGTPVSLDEAATAGTCPVCQVNHTWFFFACLFGQNCRGRHLSSSNISS